MLLDFGGNNRAAASARRSVTAEQTILGIAREGYHIPPRTPTPAQTIVRAGTGGWAGGTDLGRWSLTMREGPAAGRADRSGPRAPLPRCRGRRGIIPKPDCFPNEPAREAGGVIKHQRDHWPPDVGAIPARSISLLAPNPVFEINAHTRLGLSGRLPRAARAVGRAERTPVMSASLRACGVPFAQRMVPAVSQRGAKQMSRKMLTPFGRPPRRKAHGLEIVVQEGGTLRAPSRR